MKTKYRSLLRASLKYGCIFGIITLAAIFLYLPIRHWPNYISWPKSLHLPIILLGLFSMFFFLPILWIQGMIKDTYIYNFLRGLNPGDDDPVWLTLAVIVNIIIGMLFGIFIGLLRKENKKGV